MGYHMAEDELNAYIDSHFTPSERRRGALLRVMRIAACLAMTIGLMVAGLVTVIMLLAMM